MIKMVIVLDIKFQIVGFPMEINVKYVYMDTITPMVYVIELKLILLIVTLILNYY